MTRPDSTTSPASVPDPDDALDALAAAGLRFEWYRDGFRALLGLLLIGALVLALSLTGLGIYSAAMRRLEQLRSL